MGQPSSKDEMTVRHQFDRLCQMALKGEAVNYYKHMDYRRKHEVTFSELSEKELSKLFTMDEYGTENHHFEVHGYDIEVKNTLIAEALKELTERKRNVILLSYFMEMSDADIARSTNKKLESLGIRTIGGLAQMDEKILQSRLGKMGAVLWAFANGYDDSPVKRENTSAPIKSIGNSTTTPKELETDEDVKIMLYILSESVAVRLRENGFRCRTVEISIRDNELYSFTRQCKLDNASNITGEIASMAYRLFKANYRWDKPIRSVGVRGADLVNDNYMEQLDLFCDFQMREKQMKMDVAVDDIRRRFGFYSIQRGLMYRDRALSAVNAKEDHTVHPHGYFG